jgi:hypothetical protein
LSALERVNDSAEAAVTHLLWFTTSVERIVQRLDGFQAAIVALPAQHRGELKLAALGILDGIEDLGEAATAVITDYAECLLLAQACAIQLTSDGKELSDV